MSELSGSQLSVLLAHLPDVILLSTEKYKVVLSELVESRVFLRERRDEGVLLSDLLLKLSYLGALFCVSKAELVHVRGVTLRGAMGRKLGG